MTVIKIDTTDKNFANDFKVANFDGLNISQRIFFRDSADVKPIIDEVLKFTISISDTVGGVTLGLFINWLYDKIKGNQKERIVINDNVISADTVQITQITQIIIGDNKTHEH